jgi:dipeptidyl aminopeptidase/acylaminoacyl peptidase
MVVALVLSILAALSARAQPSLGIDALVDIRHPSGPVWSPDGMRLAFIWDRAGVQNVFLIDLGGAEPRTPRALTSFDAGDVSGLFWSADGAEVRFGRDGDLWSAGAAPGSGARRLWTTAEPEGNFAPSPDGKRVAFARGADVWVRSLADEKEARLTETPEIESGLAWSPDGARIAFTTSSATRHENAPDYSGVKVLYTWIERAFGDVGVVSSDGTGAATRVEPSAEFRESGVRWVDSSRIVFERVHDDTTKREIVVADASTGRGSAVVRERDEKWWSIPAPARPGPVPSPDGRWIAFVSDRDGWDHVYVVPSAGGAAVAITRGAFEAWRPSWSPDSSRIAFDANEPGKPGVRQVWVAAIGSDPARAGLRALTSGRGTNVNPLFSPDGKRLVYQHTDARSSADLFSVSDHGQPTRLTESLPATIDRETLVEPELVWYEAADGQKVPAFLFVPPDLDRSKKHPAIVWIHGDGHNQNYDGWHVERNYAVYYSFHQYLLQRGYVVIAPDYRGSIGYGKAWRQGVFLDVGGKDSRDATEAATYLKTLGYVDPNRIGVWGLSYGGFFTLLALVDAPKTFACGVNVAGVVDYRMYYEDPWHGAWTYGRLRAPEDNPKAYDVASPLSRMERLERPLLILHGTADVNVPYLHSVRLVDDLLARRKDFEFMAYPGEFHYFTRERVLRDAWGRVERFFDQHLKE